MNEADGLQAFQARVRQGVEAFLDRAYDAYPDTVVRQAAVYASLGGGHRWRAMATLAAGAIFDPDAFDICLPCACGVELAHAASLILDDLPSMDDAELRRGKPCVHLVFPPWAVDMAPTFLILMAYQISLSNPLATHERRVAAAVALSEAGLRMIGGQENDLAAPLAGERHRADGDGEELLLERYRLKTGEGFAIAAKAGAILAGAGPEDVQTLYDCGMALGISYQIADDVADQVAATADVAKSVQRDHGKLTYASLYGLDAARAEADRYRGEALAILDAFGAEADLLRSLVARACCVVV